MRNTEFHAGHCPSNFLRAKPLQQERDSRMTLKQLEAAAAKQLLKYDTAKKIRSLLDTAKQAYGAEKWDEDNLAAEILELVTEPE